MKRYLRKDCYIGWVAVALQIVQVAQLRADLAVSAPGAGGVQGNPGQTNTYGWIFSVGGNDLRVTGLGVWDEGQDGLNAAHQVGIWSSAGALMSSVVVPAGTAAPLNGEFRILTLANPFTLAAGSNYTIGALYQGDDNFHGPQSGAPTVAPEILNVEGRFD